MEKQNRIEQIRKIVLSLLTVICIVGMIIHIGPHNGIIGEEIENPTSDITVPSYITYELDGQNEFVQTFVPEYSYIKEIRTILLQVGDNCTGKLKVTITDTDGNLIYDKEKDLEDLKLGDWNRFNISKKVKEGKQYSLTLSAVDTNVNPTILVINSAFALDECIDSNYGNQQIAGDLLLSISYKETKSILFRGLVCFFLAVLGIILLFAINVKEAIERAKTLLYQENDLKNIVFLIGLAVTTCLIIFVHCYKLISVPYGIHVDEMGSGYDAYCIANWGVDRFQMSYPVYFINIGTGQNALYAYMAAILFKIFGYSELMLRVPAVINAFLTVIFGALLVHKKWHTKQSVLLFTALYAILPYFIMSTRFGLESYLMLGFSALFLYTLIHAVERGKWYQYVISGICGGILLYTYAISYIVMVIFLFFMLLYLIRLHKLNLKQFIAFVIPLAIIGMPLVLCQIINMFDLPEIKIGLMTITKLQGYRGSEIELNHIVANLLTTLKSVFWHDSIHYNSFPEYMTMYWVSIPLILIGICHACGLNVQNIKNRIWSISDVMLLWFFCLLGVGCLLGGNGPNCNKVNGIYIACIFFLVEGIYTLAALRKNEKWATSLLLISAISYIVCFTTFADYYFYRYAKDYYPEDYFETTYADALQILNNAGDATANRTTYIEEYSAIYYCGSTLISPYDFPYEHGMTTYKNYVFHYGGEQDMEANYILRDTNKDTAIEFEKAGFIVQKVNGWFVCYKQS